MNIAVQLAWGDIPTWIIAFAAFIGLGGLAIQMWQLQRSRHQLIVELAHKDGHDWPTNQFRFAFHNVGNESVAIPVRAAALKVHFAPQYNEQQAIPDAVCPFLDYDELVLGPVGIEPNGRYEVRIAFNDNVPTESESPYIHFWINVQRANSVRSFHRLTRPRLLHIVVHRNQPDNWDFQDERPLRKFPENRKRPTFKLKNVVLHASAGGPAVQGVSFDSTIHRAETNN